MLISTTEYDYGYDLAGKFEPSVLKNNKISDSVVIK